VTASGFMKFGPALGLCRWGVVVCCRVVSCMSGVLELVVSVGCRGRGDLLLLDRRWLLVVCISSSVLRCLGLVSLVVCIACCSKRCVVVG